MFPILLRLGGLTIHAYGFFVALGFIAGLVLAMSRARKEGIAFERVVDLFFYTVLSAIIGSRILFALINFDFFRKDPLQIIRMWEGGIIQ